MTHSLSTASWSIRKALACHPHEYLLMMAMHAWPSASSQPAAPDSSSGGKKAKVLVILTFKDTQVIHSTLYCSLLYLCMYGSPLEEETNNVTLQYMQ